MFPWCLKEEIIGIVFLPIHLRPSRSRAVSEIAAETVPKVRPASATEQRDRVPSSEYFIQTTHLRALAVHAWELAEADPNKRLNVKALRERTGMSRHLSVPLVEYFDQIGLTRRDEVGRHFRRDPRLVFDA